MHPLRRLGAPLSRGSTLLPSLLSRRSEAAVHLTTCPCPRPYPYPYTAPLSADTHTRSSTSPLAARRRARVLRSIPKGARASTRRRADENTSRVLERLDHLCACALLPEGGLVPSQLSGLFLCALCGCAWWPLRPRVAPTPETCFAFFSFLAQFNPPTRPAAQSPTTPTMK